MPAINGCSKQIFKPMLRSSTNCDSTMQYTSAKLFVFVIATILTTTASEPQHPHSGCIPHERAGLLLSFKQQGITEDPNNVFGSWKGQNCCQWRGIKCSKRTGHVIKLHLRNDEYINIDDDYDSRKHGFSGKISRSLLSLDHLEYLDLSMNQLEEPTGRFPEFLCSLKRLRHLNLSGITFQGILPPQLGNLSNLQYFDILGSNFGCCQMYSTDMSWLTQLSSLEYFSIPSVNLSTIVDWAHLVNMIPSLRVLVLSGCSLASARQSLFQLNLTKLEKLDLSSNLFNHLVGSSWFWGLKSLEYLDLSSNRLYGRFPDALGNMTSLKVLDFSNNLNKDLSTPNLTSLCNLQVLDLRSNFMQGVVLEKLPPCAWNNLQCLDLSENHMTGTLPNWIGSLISLRGLYLSSNRLSGHVPSEIGALSNLTSLDLSNNTLSGSVREKHLESMISLKMIDMSDNGLSILVGPNWLPPFKLEHALLASCQLGHAFPSWLRSQVDIMSLDISSAGIKDRLPEWLWEFQHGGYLNIAHNHINGELPENMEAMSWAILWLNSNELRGPIPPLPTDLEMLDISMNSFSGSLPSNFGSMGIETLVMFSNNITGNLPTSMCELQNLVDLDLSNNLLEGEIPQCFQANEIEYLLLSNNSFSGKFPTFLQNCTELVILDLTRNMFSGSLPTWVDGLANLEFLLLSHNMLSGNMITRLGRLQYLDLASNNLSGAIPCYLANLTSMTQKGLVTSSDSVNINPFEHGSYELPLASQFEEIIPVDIKGQELKYGHGIRIMVGIDLSCNRLTGRIPEDISSLDGLVNLNLSLNELSGDIPDKIGAMHSLESLDLSRNRLSGEIPPSLSNLTYLVYLNMSYNNLSGKIPSGQQLGTLNVDDPYSMYIGNNGLCGPPLQKKCPRNDTSMKSDLGRNGQADELSYSYVGFTVGIIVGLMVVFCALLFKPEWMVAYFHLFDKLHNRIYVFVVTNWARMYTGTTVN